MGCYMQAVVSEILIKGGRAFDFGEIGGAFTSGNKIYAKSAEILHSVILIN